MYVLTKKELEQLQAEAAIAQVKARLLKQDLSKAVQMAGTGQPMPVLPQRARPTTMNTWEVEEGLKHDQESARLAEERRIASSQPAPAQPPPQQRLRTTTVRTEEYLVPDAQNSVQGGQVQQEDMANPTPPWDTTQPSPATLKEEENSRYVRQISGEAERNGGAPIQMEEDGRIADAMRQYFARFQQKREEAEARLQAEIPPADTGASASDLPPGLPADHTTQEHVDAVNGNPPSKLGASPGISGSSGVYRLNAGHPDLEKGFQKMGRTARTYCKMCGVSVDEEGGDEAHFKKSGHNSFRKI